jgi:hypothetical protein
MADPQGNQAQGGIGLLECEALGVDARRVPKDPSPLSLKKASFARKTTFAGEGGLRIVSADGMIEPGSYYGERRFARFRVDVPVVAQASQFPDRKLHGMIRNIGRGGLLAEFALQLAPGRLVDLTLHTRDGLREERARVVWRKVAWGVVLHGLAFPTPKEQDFALDLFLAENRWDDRESGAA